MKITKNTTTQNQKNKQTMQNKIKSKQKTTTIKPISSQHNKEHKTNKQIN